MLPLLPRQLRLGASASGSLTLVDSYTPPPAEAPFLNLPSEILFRIFELAVIPDRDSDAICLGCEQCNYTAILTLLLTCRQIGSLCLPLMYRDIHFHRDAVIPPGKRPKLLHRSLRCMPGLGRHCLTLTMEGGYPGGPAPGPHSSAIANDLISWLPSVRDLRIQGDFESQSIWSLIRAAVTQMPRVEILSLSVWSLAMQPIFDSAKFPLLKKLVLDGLSSNGGGPIKVHSKNQRTAPFTKLSLSDYDSTYTAVSQLLLWPEHLTQFLLKSYSYNRLYIDPQMVRVMLLPHRGTLERIDIGSQRHTDLESVQLLDVSDFPKLKRLGLSRRQMPKDLVFCAADSSLLLAPKLRTFEWDFSVKDCYGLEASHCFGEMEENWLREFLRMAIKKKAALKNVVVGFGTESWSSPIGNDGTWDRLESLKNEFHPLGVTVTYTNPWLHVAELEGEFD